MVFNTLVLIIQSFQKIGPLHALAPLGNNPAIPACQVVLLLASLAAGIFAVLRSDRPCRSPALPYSLLMVLRSRQTADDRLRPPFGWSIQVRVIDVPPSTRDAVPVTKLASSDAR